MGEKVLKKREPSFDLIRVIAILCVVMVHVTVEFLELWKTSPNSFSYISTNVIDSLSRCGVGLFLMLSGALLLDENRKITIEIAFKKYICPMACLLFFWSAVYTIVTNVLQPIVLHNQIDIGTVVHAFFFGHYHMWYLFALIGLYLVTPILKCFVKIENKKIVLYYILLSIIFQFALTFLYALSSYLPIFASVGEWLNGFKLNFGGFVTYYLLGWYIKNVGFEKKHRICIYVLGLVFVVLLFLFKQQFPNQIVIFNADTGCFVLFPAVALFVLIKQTYRSTPKKDSILQKLSPLTFGVYLIHLLVLNVFIMIVPHEAFSSIVYIFLSWGVSLVVSFVLCFVISKIPLLKKIIRT